MTVGEVRQFRKGNKREKRASRIFFRGDSWGYLYSHHNSRQQLATLRTAPCLRRIGISAASGSSFTAAPRLAVGHGGS